MHASGGVYPEVRRGFALPLIVTLCLAAGAGVATAMAGTMFGTRAVYYLAVFGAGGAAALVAFTRKEPLRFIFLALLVAFPIANALVPPGRIGITLFDAVMVVLTLGLVFKNATAPAAQREPLFPTRSLLIVWLLWLPCVALSQFPGIAAVVLLLVFGLYTFFVLALAELKRAGGFERLALFLSGLLIVMAAGVFVDHTWHINLSLRGSNLNQLTYLAGLEIYRAGGFFQDPQRCGAFFAVVITFLLVLAVRHRFAEPKIRFVVWLAILAGLAALLLTISRSAILACLAVSACALFFFNAWSWHVKAAIVAAVLVVATIVLQSSADTWLGLLPPELRERILQSPEELENRLYIWFDTWDMFTDHPLTGIGPASFRSYLLETRPGVFNYYGIGAAAGVEYIPEQPESGYLKILYEGGVVGSLAALVLVGDAVRRALAVALGTGAEPHARTECIAALAALVAFGVPFVTQFTMADARVGALFAFLLAVIWKRSLERQRTARGV